MKSECSNANKTIYTNNTYNTSNLDEVEMENGNLSYNYSQFGE
jgi:hypothetical protein